MRQTNLAAAHPDKVAAMQARLNALGKESAKPLALIYVTRVGLAHGKPLMASEDGTGPVIVEDHGHAITDEGFGETEVGARPSLNSDAGDVKAAGALNYQIHGTLGGSTDRVMPSVRTGELDPDGPRH